MTRLLIAASGTGGHLFPALAVAEAVDDGLHVVCSAVIFDDLLRLVRGWVRLGHSAEEIQAELDVRFRDALDTLTYQQLED